MIKFRAWDKKLQTMLDVSLIDFKKRCFSWGALGIW